MNFEKVELCKGDENKTDLDSPIVSNTMSLSYEDLNSSAVAPDMVKDKAQEKTAMKGLQEDNEAGDDEEVNNSEMSKVKQFFKYTKEELMGLSRNVKPLLITDFPKELVKDKSSINNCTLSITNSNLNRSSQQLGNRNIKPRNLGMNWMPCMIPQPPPRQPSKISEVRNLENVDLQKDENPRKAKSGAAKTTDINEEIVSQARGIFNELTLDNFDKLVVEFLKLPLEDNHERIDSVVRIVFEKSINVPSFSAVYAKMVHAICKTSQETSKIFRKMILDQCQIEFQKSSTDETDIKEIEIEIEKTNDESIKQSLNDELVEKRAQMRRRSLGNVRFIGELYKLQMLTPRIMIDCVTMLLSMDEENLECLCLLLTTVGLRLEEQIKDVERSNELERKGGQVIKYAPEPKWLEKTFNKIYDLSKEESLSSRIRSVLLDVYELRQNNWKPRGEQVNVPELVLKQPRQPRQIIKVRNLGKVELHKAENPWKSTRRGADTTDINEQIVRQARGILNKLTPDNFDKLVEKFLKLPFDDNEERIASVVHVMFEKSINEPLFSTVYAKMVYTICQNSQDTFKIFRTKILDQCLLKFLKIICKCTIDETIIKKIKISIEKTDDESIKQSLMEELEEKQIQKKRRSLGNIRFIGELYKLQMLTPVIMIECVRMLLSMDEENLEYLCLLLTTAGLKIEEQIKDVEYTNEQKRNDGQEIRYFFEPKWLDMTFNKIYDLSKDDSFSFRIRFALLDLYELRQNNWKPRREPNTPKKIEEIHRDALRKDQEEKMQTKAQRQQRCRGDIKKLPVSDWNISDWNPVPNNKSYRFQKQKQKDQQPPKRGNRSSPFLPQLLQMTISQPRSEKLTSTSQPTLLSSSRHGCKRVKSLSDEIKSSTPNIAEIVSTLQSNLHAQQKQNSSIQKSPALPENQLSRNPSSLSNEKNPVFSVKDE